MISQFGIYEILLEKFFFRLWPPISSITRRKNVLYHLWSGWYSNDYVTDYSCSGAIDATSKPFTDLVE